MFLKLQPGELDKINSPLVVDPLLHLVNEWFNKFPMSDSERWEELHRVLLEPAVNELTVANGLPVNHRGHSLVSHIGELAM